MLPLSGINSPCALASLRRLISCSGTRSYNFVGILLVTVAGIAEQRHGDSKRQMLNEACQEIGYEEHISSFGVEGNCKKPGVMQRVIRECEYTKTLISKPLSCEVYIQQ